MKYAIISGWPSVVEDCVNTRLREGWRLYGGLAMAADDEQRAVVAQAMTLREGRDDDES
jgi:hypothetical protein